MSQGFGFQTYHAKIAKVINFSLILLPTSVYLSNRLGKDVYNHWNIGVVIPARNEEDFISGVLQTIPTFVDNVIVVDDGSEDSTADICKQFLNSRYKLSIIQNHGNGVGSAIDRGHQELLDISDKPFISVVMAGDGQMNPDDMENLIQPIIQEKADYSKGNRFIHREGTGKMPLIRKIASIILSFFTTLASGLRISDPQCGYTATSFKILETWDWEKSWKGYGYPNDWIINLTKNSWRIKEVPVKSIYGSEKSSINNLTFFVKVGFMMFVQHHRRVFSKLLSKNVNPHTILAFVAYMIGWIAIIPNISTDLEREFIERGLPTIILIFIAWSCAHILDRLSVKVSEELKHNA